VSLATFGNYALAATVLASGAGLLGSIAGARFDCKTSLRAARLALHIATLLLTLCGALLLAAILGNDFRLKYVADYSEIALPLGYKIASLWAGSEGSLLLWAWMLAAVVSLAVFTWRKDPVASQAPPTAILSVLVAFFAALLLFAANPFDLNWIRDPFTQMWTVVPPPDGQGMVPVLQNLGMIWHPPMLFLGYAGFAIPFAIGLGALISGRAGNGYVASLRPWAIAAWLALGVGIILGMQWSYVEMGWGGYWKWDPVENASLLPWLTGTAMLHNIFSHQRRGMLKGWNLSMVALTFFLCIFASYLTRSGVIPTSLHSFPKSEGGWFLQVFLEKNVPWLAAMLPKTPVGWFFLTLLGLIAIFSPAVILRRRKLLKPERPLERLANREGAFVAANLLLLLMMLGTLVGTIFLLIQPLLQPLYLLIQKHFPNMPPMPDQLNEHFYNNFVLPMALVLVALMGIGPLLGPNGWRGSPRRLIAPIIAAILAAAGIGLAVAWNSWAVAAAAFSAFVLAGIFVDFICTLRARMRSTGENLLVAKWRLLRADSRRYGGQLVHASVVLIVIGVAGSSLFSVTKDFRMQPGQSVRIGGHTLRLDSPLEELDRTVKAGQVAAADEVLKCANPECQKTIHVARGATVPPCGQCGSDVYLKGNYAAIEARVSVLDDGGQASVLRPQIRYYDKQPKERSTEVAIRSRLRDDVYLTLSGEDKDKNVVIQAIVNPLLIWIWIGGGLMTLGALICLLPKSGQSSAKESIGDPSDASGNPNEASGNLNDADKQAGSNVGLPVGAVEPIEKEESDIQT
jgi:cytochrome c-type biogenesis protein CcmF